MIDPGRGEEFLNQSSPMIYPDYPEPDKMNAITNAVCSYLLAEEPLSDEESMLTYLYSHVSPEKAGSAAWQLERHMDNEGI